MVKLMILQSPKDVEFLYSQEISNGKTLRKDTDRLDQFLYSQEISNGKTGSPRMAPNICVFVLSRNQ